MRHKERSRKDSNHPGLQLEQDLAFLKREWQAQRAGWFLLALIALAAVLGLFGRGLFSSASVANGGLQLKYEWLERYQRPTSMQLQISANPGANNAVLIDRGYLDAIRIERIMPQPEQVVANARGLIYHFAAGADPIRVTFHFELEQFGMVQGQIGLIEGPMISFNQFVYP